MLQAKILAVSILMLFRESLAQDCDETSANSGQTRKVFDLQNVQKGQYNFVVALRSISGLSCTGSVLGERHVLTAGSCFKGEDPSDIYAIPSEVFSAPELENPTLRPSEFSGATRVKKMRASEIADIKLLILKRPLTRVARIPLSGRDLEDDEVARVVGLGFNGTKVFTVRNQWESLVNQEVPIRLFQTSEGYVSLGTGNHELQILEIDRLSEGCLGDTVRGAPITVETSEGPVLAGIVNGTTGPCWGSVRKPISGLNLYKLRDELCKLKSDY